MKLFMNINNDYAQVALLLVGLGISALFIWLIVIIIRAIFSVDKEIKLVQETNKILADILKKLENR